MEIIRTQKGSLSVLGGKTDMGKSTIACFDCAEQLRAGKNVMFFSLEYCQAIIYTKLVSHFSLQFQELFKLNVVEASNWDLDLIKEEIRRNKGVVDTVYIDFLELLAKNVDSSYSTSLPVVKNEIKQRIIAELAQLAYELQIDIVVLGRVHSSLDLNATVDYINLITSCVHSPAPVIKMFIGKDEALNPVIKGNDMSHVIIIDGNDLVHFSSINLKQAYKN